MKNGMSKRIDWIDSLRALAVFFIVLGHTLRGESIYYYLYTFHVPLCVMISGFCFSNKKSFSEHIKKVIKRNYYPYIGFSLLSIMVYFAMSPILDGKYCFSELPYYFIGMLYGNGDIGMQNGGYMKWNLPLWYLPFNTLMEIIAFFVFCPEREERTVTGEIKIVLGSIFVAIIWNKFPVSKINYPFSFETVVSLFPFFATGKLLRTIGNEREEMNKSVKLLMGTSWIFWGLLLSRFNENVDYVSDCYGKHYITFIVVALLISVGLFEVVSSLKSSQCIQFVGKNTMTILGLHKFPIMIYILVIAPRIEFSESHVLTMSLMVCVVAIYCCIQAKSVAEYILRILCRNHKKAAK